MTTPLASKPLIEALLTMVRASVGVSCSIYWAQAATSAAPPYAVVYPDSGVKSSFNRNLANAGPDELRFQVTSVGSTPEQAQWVADKTAYALLTAVPAVAGRRVWPAVEEGSQPIRRDDESTGLFFATAQYVSRSDPT